MSAETYGKTADGAAPWKGGGAPPLLAVEAIHKRFPGVHALKGVSFEVRAGEIHALVGENGAGKSTLMRILAGVHPPDEGAICIDGTAVAIGSPAEGLRLGIAMVYQDTRLAPTLDVAWNLALGHEPGGAVFIDRRAMDEAARAALAAVGADIDPRRMAGDLSRAERQQVEIARALSRCARVLILDEPTSALTLTETERLMEILSGLRARGTGIVFISHRVPEVLALADRITVLKDGEVAGEVAAAAATPQQIVEMMVGRPIGLAFPQRSEGAGEVAACLRLTGDADAAEIVLRRGNITGFAGLQDAGQSAAGRALFGDTSVAYDIEVGSARFQPRGPADALAASVVYVPADRRGEGLSESHGIRENIALPLVDRWATTGLLATGREATEVDKAARAIGVKAPDWETPLSSLSGGNQQKVVFARWGLQAADVLVFDEPTQGVDVATKLELYRLIRDRATAGAAVAVISSDLIELIGLSDRIMVFSDGRPVREVDAATATEAGILSLAVTGGRRNESCDSVAKGARRAQFGRYGPTALLLLLVAAIFTLTAANTDFFLTPRNLGSLAGQAAPLLFAALGQMAVILLGGIDLTVGPIISLVTTIASYLLAPDALVPAAVGIAACLGAGLAVGALNAAVIVVFRVPDLVATLGTFSVVQGLALMVRPSPGGTLDPEIAAAITERIGRLPLAFIAVLLVFLLAEAILARGRLGARLYALGGSAEAAAVAGIRGDRLRAMAYMFSGFMAAVAGLIIAARIGSGDPQAGSAFTLASVTAVVAGGTSVFGGVGTAAGTFLGAILVVLIQNVLNQFQVSAYWQYIWTGLLTIAAVAGHGLRSSDRRRAMTARARAVFRVTQAKKRKDES